MPADTVLPTSWSQGSITVRLNPARLLECRLKDHLSRLPPGQRSAELKSLADQALEVLNEAAEAPDAPVHVPRQQRSCR